MENFASLSIPHVTPEFPWSLWIWTSDIKGAGTDAQVFLQIFGEKGKSDEIKLENNSDSFEQAQLDRFMVSRRVPPKLSVSLSASDGFGGLINLCSVLSLWVWHLRLKCQMWGSY